MDAYGFADLRRPCPLTRIVIPTFEAEDVVLLVSILMCRRRWTLLASWTRAAASNEPELSHGSKVR